MGGQMTIDYWMVIHYQDATSPQFISIDIGRLVMSVVGTPSSLYAPPCLNTMPCPQSTKMAALFEYSWSCLL